MSSHCPVVGLIVVVTCLCLYPEGARADPIGPGGRPHISYTDVQSGPNSGGEADQGVYLSLFGKHLGAATGLGKATKVFIGGVEVANYRSLGPSRGRQDIQQLTVQIGALKDSKPGVPLPVEAVVNGVASNRNLSFTINPGHIYFVSPAGSDWSGDGSFTRPYRTVQTSAVNNNGAAGCPAPAGEQAVSAAGVWGRVAPGDVLVLRGGIWTSVGRDEFFLRVQNKSGSRPTGRPGSGPITVMGYPGETAFVHRTKIADDQDGGGISSADTERQKLGCGAWVTVTNLKIEAGLNDGPVNTQEGALNPAGSHWRVVNNELTAKGCIYNTKCRAGGVAGSGAGNQWIGNHVHDVFDKPDGYTDFENHGFYIGGPGSFEVAFNRIEDIFGGNGIQIYTKSKAGPPIGNALLHHNLIRNVGKHGINISSGAGSGVAIFNNIVHGSAVAALRIFSEDLYGARVFNNTFYDTDRLGYGKPRAAIMNDGNLRAGALEFRNNIVVAGGAGRVLTGGLVGFSALADGMSHNLWFLGTGPTPGHSSKTADPLFTSTLKGAEDFSPRRGSPAIDGGSDQVAPLVVDDFYLLTARPQGQGFDIGAIEVAQ